MLLKCQLKCLPYATTSCKLVHCIYMTEKYEGGAYLNSDLQIGFFKNHALCTNEAAIQLQFS